MNEREREQFDRDRAALFDKPSLFDDPDWLKRDRERFMEAAELDREFQRTNRDPSPIWKQVAPE